MTTYIQYFPVNLICLFMGKCTASMAAGYNSLLHTLYICFLLFSSLACLRCQRKFIFKDIYYHNQTGFWISAHPTPDIWINYYFNVTFHFKCRRHGFISDKLSLPISKSTKHGLITLALPHSFILPHSSYRDLHITASPIKLDLPSRPQATLLAAINKYACW